MVLKQRDRVKIVLIFAFMEALIVFIFNILLVTNCQNNNEQLRGSNSHVPDFNLILVIASSLWMTTVFIASIGFGKRRRYWFIPLITLIHISIVTFLFGICVVVEVVFNSSENIININDWDGSDTTICISWHLFVIGFAFIGTGLSIYFRKILHNYYYSLSQESESVHVDGWIVIDYV